MIALDEALNRIRGTVAPLDAEMVPIGEAAGRTLAADVAARRSASRCSSRLATGKQYICGLIPPTSMALRFI